MPFVRHFALFLNISIPIYFCYYQIINLKQSPGPSQQNSNLVSDVLLALLVLLSPVLHVLALTNPSHCFNGHCPPPKHCTKRDNQAHQNIYHNINQTNLKERSLHNFQSNQKQRNHFFPQQNNDFIKESNASSKEENPFAQHHFAKLFQKEQANPLKEQSWPNNKNNGHFFKLHRIGPSSPISSSSEQQKQKEQKQINKVTNINEFSNIPFFRSSHRSLSNIGNDDSPRLSRKSVNQPQSFLIQPLINKTPRLHESTPSPTPKKNISSNFSSQATQQFPRMKVQCEYCEDCQIPKYLRMKHCYRCHKCVHKYDHHCVLLDICIGEANQKYYIAFLYANLYNTVFVLKQLLILIKDDVFIDEVTGIEYLGNGYTLKAFAIIVLILNLLLTAYLIVMHTNFLFNGSTTYEKQRRQTINFFRFIKKNFYLIQGLKNLNQDILQHYNPFDEGCLTNVCKIINASSKPYDWQLPYKECDTCIQMKERKEKAKPLSEGKNEAPRFLGREWGEQSESSNNIHAGKTTKSRQSAIRKSKEEEQRPFDKLTIKR